MKTSTDFYPFAVYAETKQSSAGKQYISIGVCHKDKDRDGNKRSTYFNLINKTDLLVLAKACEKAYEDICFAENKERFPDKQKEEEPQEEAFDDDIPF